MVARAVGDGHPSEGRKAHIVPDTDGKLVGLTKASMDYMYLHERSETGQDEKFNPPHLLMVEHKHGRVWADRVHKKGVNAGASWLPKRIVQDWDNNGMEDALIQFKTDQEPAIVQLQAAIQEIRTVPVLPVNSPVGESESNGRVENAIKRVQEKIRSLRSQIEHNTRQGIRDDTPIMAWLVRWAVELISRHAPAEDGKSAFERIRKEKCVVPLAMFGETVLYLPLKTAKGPKGQTARRVGTWLGTIERIEEVLIGTDRGVIKCRSISRLPDGEK